MLEIQPCTVAEFFEHPDAPALLAEYAAESCISGLPRPTPHEATYRLLEHSGCMQVIAAYEGERMLGFLVLLISVNPHYSATIAVVESYFVALAHRKSGAGLALRKHAEQAATAQQAVGILISAPAGGKLAQVLEHDKAYTETNRAFFRRLS